MIRRILPFALLISCAAVFAACSDDDDDADDDTNIDAGKSNPDATTDRPDSSSSDPDAEATDSGGSCQTCGDGLQNGLKSNVCDSAIRYITDMTTCTCKPDNCATECPQECANGTFPSQTCLACIQTKCGAELSACLNDDGTYRPADGGTEESDASVEDAGSSDASTDAAADGG